MKDSLLNRLETLRTRLIELDHCLLAPDVTQQLDQYRKLTRERAELVPVVELYDAYRHTLADMEAATTLGLEDPEWRHFADEETEQGKRRLEQLESAIQTALLPRDPNDGRNIFLEIRAGTGGDESALFAGDLFRMYSRFAERLGWRTEIISHNPGEMGGFKEIIFRIEGAGAYSRFKFESGGHRVQRVPATETQGRIHTSACTVAVLPEADEVGVVTLNPAELRIDTFRASGAGGGNTSTRPIRRCASPICPPDWWWNARMVAANTKTRHRLWPCWPRGCETNRNGNNMPGLPPPAVP